MTDWLMAIPGWLACFVLVYDKLAAWRAWWPYDLCRHWGKKKDCNICD